MTSKNRPWYHIGLGRNFEKNTLNMVYSVIWWTNNITFLYNLLAIKTFYFGLYFVVNFIKKVYFSSCFTDAERWKKITWCEKIGFCYDVSHLSEWSVSYGSILVVSRKPWKYIRVVLLKDLKWYLFFDRIIYFSQKNDCFSLNAYF